MYYNYGPKVFTNNGRLLERLDKHNFNIIACNKTGDNKYSVYECFVYDKEKFIDKDDVYNFIGVDYYSPEELAVGCLDYYGIEAFCNKRHRYTFTREELENYLDTIELGSDIELN